MISIRHLPIVMVIFLAAACMVAPVNAVFAQESQDPATIHDTAMDFALSQTTADPDKIEITLGKIDPRLNLPRCDTSLEAFKSPGARMLGNTSIGVRCDGTSPWKLYVPVKISVYEKVLVAKNYLKRGAQIKESDIEAYSRDLSTLTRGYITEPKQIIGQVLKQPLMADAVITPIMLEAQKLIRRGEGVIILAKNDGFEVRMKGKALVDGINGQIIRVENLASQRIVEGQVISRGVVSVPM